MPLEDVIDAEDSQRLSLILAIEAAAGHIEVDAIRIGFPELRLNQEATDGSVADRFYLLCYRLVPGMARPA